MAGIHFLHSSSPPCVYTHMAFIIVFPLPNDPNPKKQGRPVLEIFRGRQIYLPGIFSVPRDGPSSCGPEMHCAHVLKGCSHHFHSPPHTQKEGQKKKISKGRENIGAHCMEGIYFSFTAESDKGSTLDASGESTFTTCNCPAAVKRCSTLRLCVCPFELTEDGCQSDSVFSSTSEDTNSKTSKKECEDILKT